MDGVAAEDATSGGRLDLVVLLGNQVFPFKFNFAQCSERGTALEQLRARGYTDKCRAQGCDVRLVGVESSAGQARRQSIGTPPA